MQSHELIVNTLAEEAGENNINLKRVCFRKIIDNDLLDFPEMSLDEKKNILHWNISIKARLVIFGR